MAADGKASEPFGWLGSSKLSSSNYIACSFTSRIQHRPVESTGRQFMYFLFALSLLFHSSALAQTKPIRRVLILNEAGTAYPGINLVDQGLRVALDNAPYKIEYYREYMETVLFPEQVEQQRFREFVLSRYRNRRPDVIVTVGPSPLKFMIEVHKKFFPDIPVVFCLPNGILPGHPEVDTDFTGVETSWEPSDTLHAAVRLKPDTRRVLVVGGGTSQMGKQTLAVVRQRLRSYTGSIEISYLTNCTMPDLLEQIRHLPPHTVILFIGLAQDAAGTRFTGVESSSMVTAAANAPVFGLTDIYLRHGEVGGKLYSLTSDGRVAGALVLRLLNGEKPQNVGIVEGRSTYMFDWRALRRWGLKEKDLPPGSILLNREPTIWETYRWYIIAGFSLMILQAGLIITLLWHRARRRKAELEVAAALRVAQESEQRFRLVANSAPVMIWMSGTDKLCNYVNQPWLDLTGRDLVEELGNGWLDTVHPDDVKGCMDTYAGSFERREPFTMQYRVRHQQGDYRWVLDRGVPRFSADGAFAGYIGSCVDITENKLAEEALSGVSRRLIEAQEQERTRISRELHDDINQRIAMLGIELDVLQQSLPPSGDEVQARLDHLRQLASDIGTEVQGISHRLHSSKLEYLGLVAACKSFCRETAEWHKLKVSFSADNIPSEMPQDVSLCLFRVLQESLNNAIKHSGAQSFEVELRGFSGEIQLIVRDDGVGFDAASALISRGLGIVSMRERVSLVSGIMLITSRPMAGTEIRVGVPIVARSMTQSASGAA